MSYKSQYTLLIILRIDVQREAVIKDAVNYLVPPNVTITSLCVRDQQEHQLVMSLTKIKGTAPFVLHHTKRVMAVMLLLHTQYLTSRIQLHSLENYG